MTGIYSAGAESQSESSDDVGLTWPQKWLLGVSSIALMTPSMGINASYFLVTPETGLPVTLAWTLAAASIGSVTLAGMTPLAARKAIRNRRWGAAGIMTLAVIPLVAFNLLNAVGAASTLKDATAGSRGMAIQVSSSIDAEVSRLEDRRKAPAALAAGRTPVMVEGELQALRADLRWGRSKQCSDVSLRDSRDFCTEYGRLTAVLGAAQAVEKLDAELDALSKQRRQGTTTAVATGTTDPASAAIVRLLAPVWALGERSVATSWALLVAIAVEVLAFVGPTIVSVLMEPQAPRGPKPAPGGPKGGKREDDQIPAQPAGDPPGYYLRPPLQVVKAEAPPAPKAEILASPMPVAHGVAIAERRPIAQPKQAMEVSRDESVVRDFMDERVDTGVRGALLQSGDFRSALKKWCQANGRDLPTPNRMWDQLDALGVKKQSRSGRIHYQGVRMKAGGLKLVKAGAS